MPHESCFYSKLTQLGYSSDSLASADERGAASINFLRGLIYPEHIRERPLDKMRTECLKLVSIILKCKLEQAILTSGSDVGEEEKDAFSLASAHRKIGDFERKSPENAPGAHKPNGRLWKRISGQVERNSLEGAHWGNS